MSVNLAIGQREKIFGVQKAPGGGKRLYKGDKKNSVDLFFSFFLDTQVFVGAPKKSAGGANW